MKLLLATILTILPFTVNAEDTHLAKHIKPIEVENAWARATLPSMRASAAYMKIINNSNTEDCLIAAESTTISDKTDIHTTMADEHGMLTMQHVDEICIPAKSYVELNPGEFHIMFMRLKSRLKIGHEVPITLTFKNYGKLNIRAEVKSLAGTKQGNHHEHGQHMHH